MCSVVVRVPSTGQLAHRLPGTRRCPHPSLPMSMGTSIHKEHPQHHLDGWAQGAASARACSLFMEKSPGEGSLRLAQQPPALGRPSDRSPWDWPGKTRHPLRTTGLPSPGPAATRRREEPGPGAR